MKRREFITLLGGVAAWPLAARAQRREKPARIGYLSASSPPDNTLESFLAGMRALGYGEGRDFVVEVRYAGRDYSRFPALVEELLRARVDAVLRLRTVSYLVGCTTGRLATFSPLRMRLSGFRAMQKSVQCASVRVHLGNLG
jgi:hypothetical protein